MKDIDHYISEIVSSNQVISESGQSYKLHSNIDQKEGEFIKKIIQTHKPINTIEIGCAYGISSLYICSGFNREYKCRHTIIDPSQSTYWNNIGRFNLEKAGIDFFEIIEQPSEIALPYLLSQKKQYDFGFIDGWHTFDHTLIDFFYLNRLIKVGGIIVIDDTDLPSINKVIRYIMNYPAYEIIGSVESGVLVSWKRKLFNLFFKKPFLSLSDFFTKRIREEMLAMKFTKDDKALGIHATMIAFRKMEEDNRSWSWFKDF